jgi:hypothetical protein
MKENREKNYTNDKIDEENGEQIKIVQEGSNLKGDYANVAVLLFLYLLQGNDSDKIFEIS